MTVRTALIAFAALLALPAAAVAQVKRPSLERPAAAILVDARDGRAMLSKDPRERRSIASTTKLMTALLTVERARPSQVFTAAAYSPAPAESKINLRKGERMRVSDLLEGLLLESANDAAVTLAEGIAGSRPAFVRQMNARARALGLNDTGYANPIGLDAPGNYSTAADLARLARVLLRDRRIAKLVDQPSAVLESGARRRLVRNRNTLVGRYRFVNGVKTGFTRQARNVLVGSAAGPLGARVISVVMGEPTEAARDADTLALLRYGLAQFDRRKLLDAETAVATSAIKYRDQRAKLVPATDFFAAARKDERFDTRVRAPKQLEGELAAGTRVGQVSVLRDGEVIKRVPLLTAAQVPGAGPLRVIADQLGVVLALLFVFGGVVAAALLALRVSAKRRDRALAIRRRERRRARTRVEH